MSEYQREHAAENNARRAARYHANRDDERRKRDERRKLASPEGHAAEAAWDRTAEGRRNRGVRERMAAKVERMEREGVNLIYETELHLPFALDECRRILRDFWGDRRKGILRHMEKEAVRLRRAA